MKKRILSLALTLLLLISAVPHFAAFAVGNAPTFVAGEASGLPGDTVTVTVSTANNPGIVSMVIDVAYDANVLELKSIGGQDFAATSFGPLTSNPIRVNWCDAISPNNSTNGVVAVLTFKIKDNAPVGDSVITLEDDPASVYDFDYNDVAFETQNGKVTVRECEHKYDDDCDANCNECGATREVPHKWENACDAECDCGATRTPEAHKYDNNCDNSCNVCGAANPDFAAHEYDNNCDADCNECGATRTPADHVYTNKCDADCNECGATRTPEAHKYDNNCDNTCNECGVANPNYADHVYDNACDTTCNECGATRTTGAHVYDNVCDTECNECHATRTVPHVYSNACDTTCNTEGCGNTREVGDHVYTNKCDADCNECGATRTPEAHKYDNNCDNSCNECGVANPNFAAHIFDNNCDNTCNVCGATNPNFAAHEYDNNCDADCNECGATRTPADHVYDNACDADCNVCGATRTPSDHVYDNACDANCNVCGATRTPADHVYDNACDTTCNVCGATRAVPGHVYADDCDATCNECGATRVAPHKWANACDAECDCGETRTPAPHKGGIANCHAKAVCDVCGAAYGELDPDNHDGEEKLVDAKPAACDEEGYTGDIYCGGCDVLLVQGKAIAKIPHTMSDWTVDEENGVKTATCEVCGKLSTVKLDKPVVEEFDNDKNIVAGDNMTEKPKLEILDDKTAFTEDIVFVADEVKNTIDEEETKKVEDAVATLKDVFEGVKETALELIAVFDLKLELHEKDTDGDVVNVEKFELAEGSQVKVTIPVPQGLKDMYDILKLIHVKDDGTAEEVDYDPVGNDMVTFIADGFSYYTFVGANKEETTTTTTTTTTKPAETTTTVKPADTTTTTKPAETTTTTKPAETGKSPDTGDNTAALWIAVVLVLALSGVLFATAKSKKISSK